jgi:hypothetical protein
MGPDYMKQRGNTREVHPRTKGRLKTVIEHKEVQMALDQRGYTAGRRMTKALERVWSTCLRAKWIEAKLRDV